MQTSWVDATVAVSAATEMPVRIYRCGTPGRSAPLVLHLHGGAFIGGSLETGRAVSTLLAETGAVVVSADYPTGRDHVFPEALHALFAALVAVHGRRSEWAGRGARLFVAGEDSGGNLAAGLALMARDQQSPPLAGQLLLSPMLDPGLATASIRGAHAGAAGCPLAEGWTCYLGSADKAAHPYAAPSNASRLGRVAPALVLSAEDDPMRDESVRYAARLRACGVCVAEQVLPAPTGWPAALHQLPQPEPAWVASVRGAFADFFRQTAGRAA